MVNIDFVNKGSDYNCLKSLYKQGLVQKEVQVRGKNGQIFIRKQWVKAGEDQTAQKQPKAQEETKDNSSSSKNEVPHKVTGKNMSELISNKKVLRWIQQTNIVHRIL